MKLQRIPYVGWRVESAIRRLKLYGYRPDMYDCAEAATWEKAGLNFAQGVGHLNAIRHSMGCPSFNPARDSIHWVLAACVGQRLKPRRILELGTYTGKFTAILSRLYPDSEIVTVDLPDDDPMLRRMYGRERPEKLESEMRQRAENIKSPNIRPVKCNSFFLLDAVIGPFDFVWVDAGHRFPDVAWDLCNAFHLVQPGGVIMIDDVTRDPNFATKNLGPDTEIVLQYIADRIPGQIHHFLKRRNENSYLHVKKFVVWLEKPINYSPPIGRT